MSMPLEQELATFERLLPELLRSSPGRFVVLRGQTVEHVEDSYEKALEWAYDRFGLSSFMVRQVLAEQPVVHLTRHCVA